MSELADLVTQHIQADRLWTPASDGLSNDIADEACVLLMAEHGLTRAQLRHLGAMLL